MRSRRLVLSLMAMLASCVGVVGAEGDGGVGGGTGTGGGGGAGGTVPPTVVAVAPANGAPNVPTSATLAVTFSEAMRTTTLQVSANPALSFQAPATWSSGDTRVVLTPAQPLPQNTQYVLTVSGQDAAGNAMASPFTFGFTTAPQNGAPPLPACTHYVSATSTSTDYAAARNIAAPCTALTAMANAVAGDTACFRGGTYDPPAPAFLDRPAYSPAHSGTAQAPITFMGFPGEDVLIHDTRWPTHPSNTHPSIGAFRADHIVWANFRLVRNLDNGIEASSIVYFDEANHVTVRNCDISGGTPHVDHTNGVLIYVLHSTYVSIHDNRLHDMVGSQTPTEETTNTGAIYFFGDDHLSVYNNDIFNVYNAVQMKVDPNQVSVYRNHIWNCQRGAIHYAPETPDNNTFDFFQNVIRDCAFGIYGPDPSGMNRDTRFFNNSLYNSGAGALAILGDTLRNAQVFNNIVSNQSGSARFALYHGGASLPLSDYNAFHGPGIWNLDWATDYSSLQAWSTGTGLDAHSVTTTPGFTTPGGTAPEDYTLQANSPLRTAGHDLGDIDGDGDTAEAVPMGAYVTGSEVIGRRAP